MGAPYDKTNFGPITIGSDVQTTVDNTSGGVALASSIPKNAIVAYVTVETASIRFTEDGKAADVPTATFGTLANPGDHFVVWGGLNIKNWLGIRTGATSATIDVQFGVM